MTQVVKSIVIDIIDGREVVNLLAEKDFLCFFNPYQQNLTFVGHPSVRLISNGLTDDGACKAILEIDSEAPVALYYFFKDEYRPNLTKSDHEQYTDFLKVLHWQGGGNQVVTKEMFLSFSNRFFLK